MKNHTELVTSSLSSRFHLNAYLVLGVAIPGAAITLFHTKPSIFFGYPALLLIIPILELCLAKCCKTTFRWVFLGAALESLLLAIWLIFSREGGPIMDSIAGASCILAFTVTIFMSLYVV